MKNSDGTIKAPLAQLDVTRREVVVGACLYGAQPQAQSGADSAPMPLDCNDVGQLADHEWRQIIEPLLPLGGNFAETISDAEDPQLRQELYRAIFSAIAAAYPSLLLTSPEYPDFVPSFGRFLNVLGPNPDFTYQMTPIDGAGVYRLSGYRGSTRAVIVQVAGGLFVPRGDELKMGEVHYNHDLDTVHIGDNGYFEVILSQMRPEGYDGDWLPIAANSTNLVVRQFSYDWLTEVDARLAIERRDTPAVQPRSTAAQLAENLQQIAVWADAYVRNSIRFSKRFETQGWVNEVGFMSFSGDGGMPAQRYMEGVFQLAEDEALIMETEVPETCRYWSFQLTDERWTSYDWFSRKTSINGHTAVLDADGKFRAVISPKDPGVANWLDTAGYKKGVIQGRWNNCSSYPMPTFTKVKSGDVLDYLPEDTQPMSPEQRDNEIRLRREGAQLRGLW